jgi:ATP-dependent DNA ligase
MAIPRAIKPMLARGGGKPFYDEDYGFEIKWDGVRCLVISDQPYRLQNRHLKVITDPFPELDFRSLPVGSVMDGEIVVLRDGIPSFYSLQKRTHLRSEAKIDIAAQTRPATFMAFDLLYDQGEKITRLPLKERRMRLAALLKAYPQERMVLSDQIVGQGESYFDADAARGLEGIIAKRLDSPYVEGKRSSSWLKVVAWQVKPLRVIGYVKQRRTDGVQAIALGRKHGNHWVYLGQVGHLPEDERVVLYSALKDAPPMSPVPKGGPRDVEWRDVDLRCYIRHFEDGLSGRLRHASFKGWAA